MACPPASNPTRPPFPSLYNPLRERYRTCEQTYSAVTHLEHAGDIFRFTLYWTLILYLPLFALPALWGLFVHFIPHRILRRKQNARNAAALSAASRDRTIGRSHIGAGSGATGDRFVYSPLAMNRPSNANALSPRSSEPFLLDSPRALTAADRGKGPETEKHRSTSRRPMLGTFGSLGSWTPSRTLQSLRRRQTDDFYAMENTRSLRSPRTPRSPTSPASPITPMSEMPNHSLPRVPTMQLTLSTTTRSVRARHSSLRNRSGGVTCLILVIPLAFLFIGAVVGLIGSLMIGYLLAALKDAAGVRISTWLPLGWAVIQVHTVLLGMFTNMISFI